VRDHPRSASTNAVVAFGKHKCPWFFLWVLWADNILVAGRGKGWVAEGPPAEIRANIKIKSVCRAISEREEIDAC